MYTIIDLKLQDHFRPQHVLAFCHLHSNPFQNLAWCELFSVPYTSYKWIPWYSFSNTCSFYEQIKDAKPGLIALRNSSRLWFLLSWFYKWLRDQARPFFSFFQLTWREKKRKLQRPQLCLRIKIRIRVHRTAHMNSKWNRTRFFICVQYKGQQYKINTKQRDTNKHGTARHGMARHGTA